MSNVLAKLGLTTRAEIAAEHARRSGNGNGLGESADVREPTG
ncbi:hypothetical protein ACFQV2_21075 [Actinokineospora soli]|uniref:Uncharacterized protein n=1 Tax=Actinokineospora soli TaxID=1048753 RepID=A0ABW2TS36_9PSEU